mmetsp:Transcript_8582/g.13406  ORF Transcript_8582/g.13406 Transcript_8582/m.13406 type:complete len:259 (-) Transcript_8582:231-1007(-)
MNTAVLMIIRLLVLVSLFSYSKCLKLNIHLPLRKTYENTNSTWCLYDSALEANLALREASSSEQLNFFDKHSPHLTIFMSDFDVQANDTDKLKHVFSTLREVVSNSSHTLCEIEWPRDPSSVVNHGFYSMYPIKKTVCLQKLSNDIVRALQGYLKRPQEIPEWVNKLPLLKRLRKIWLIKKYGSPNVFGEYVPHITVGYDESSTSDLRHKILVSAVPGHGIGCKETAQSLCIAMVGVGGSVLQDGVLSIISMGNGTRS